MIHFANFGLQIQATEMRKVFDNISEADRAKFDFDIWNLDWYEFVVRYMLGCRIFLMHEPLDNIPKAKRHYAFMKKLHYTFFAVIYLIVGYYFLKLFGLSII